MAKFNVTVFNKLKIMKFLWIKGKYIQTIQFDLNFFWKIVSYQIWTFQAALRERLIQRKNFWIQRLETFYPQGLNHELNKIQQWSFLYFTIQNQFVWCSNIVKNSKMTSSSWKIYFVSNNVVEWKVLLKAPLPTCVGEPYFLLAPHP